MVIHISNELLDNLHDPTVSLVVNRLLNLILSDGHEWMIIPGDNLRAYESQVHFSQDMRERLQQRITEHFYRPSSAEPRRVVRIVPDGLVDTKATDAAKHGGLKTSVIPGQRVCVKDGDRRLDVIAASIVTPYLTDSLKVVVENVDSDGEFVKTIIRLCEGLNVEDIESELGFEFYNGGGSTILPSVRNLKGRRRAVCIVDGDRACDGKIEPSKRKLQRDLTNICDKLGYDLVILKKREIENYLPESALKEWYEQTTGLAAGQHPYFQVPEGLRDCIDLGKGWNPPPKAAAEVAAATTAEEGDAGGAQINTGFGKQAWNAFRYVKSFEELESRDQIGELRGIVALIKDNL